ncbi:glycosyltransferase, partial [Halorubrum sp. SP3]
MHLALVVEDPASTKGPDTQANNLLKSLDTCTDTVDEITVICKDGASPDYRSSNISTADVLDSHQPFASLKRVFECCRTVDLVHVFAANWRIVLAIMGLSRTPVLLGTSTTFRALPHRIAVRLYRPNAVFASVEPFETAISEMGYRRDRTFFIPNGIDTDIFSPPGQKKREEIRRILGDRHELSLAENIIIWVNHLNDHKRPLLALQAFQQFRQQRDDVSLLMIGDGPQRAAVEEMAENISDAHCLGFIDHDAVHDYYRVADLNLVTSRSEGISNVVYEGMA